MILALSDAAVGLIGVGLGAAIAFLASFVTAKMTLQSQRNENRRDRRNRAYTELLDEFSRAVAAAAEFASAHAALGYPQENRGTDEQDDYFRSEWRKYSVTAWQARSSFRVAYTKARLVAGTDQLDQVKAFNEFLETNVYCFQPFIAYKRAEDPPMSEIAPSELNSAAAEVADRFAEALTDQM